MEVVEFFSYCFIEMVGGGKFLNCVNCRYGRNVWLLRILSWVLVVRLSCKEVWLVYNYFFCICVNEILFGVV